MENRIIRKTVKIEKGTESVLYDDVLYTEMFLYEPFALVKCAQGKLENNENADENMKRKESSEESERGMNSMKTIDKACRTLYLHYSMLKEKSHLIRSMR